MHLIRDQDERIMKYKRKILKWLIFFTFFCFRFKSTSLKMLKQKLKKKERKSNTKKKEE